MRKFNKQEMAAVSRLSKRNRKVKALIKKHLDSLRVKYSTLENGRITIAEVASGSTVRKFGIASYNKSDKANGLPMSEEIGQTIALVRALKS